MAPREMRVKFLRSVKSFVALTDRACKVLQACKVIRGTYGDWAKSARIQLLNLKNIARVVLEVPLEEPPNRISVTLICKLFPGTTSGHPPDPQFHILVPLASTISTGAQINSLNQALET